MPEPSAQPDTGSRTLPGRARRSGFVLLGCLLVGVGAVGVAVPLLPTTPFMLLAVACFARGSRRLHARLMGSRLFGPTLRAWYETRSIPLRSKVAAIGLITASFGASMLMVGHLAANIVLAAIAAGTVTWLVRIPTRTPAPPAAEAADTAAGG